MQDQDLVQSELFSVWICSQCETVNAPEHSSCEVCGGNLRKNPGDETSNAISWNLVWQDPNIKYETVKEKVPVYEPRKGFLGFAGKYRKTIYLLLTLGCFAASVYLNNFNLGQQGEWSRQVGNIDIWKFVCFAGVIGGLVGLIISMGSKIPGEMKIARYEEYIRREIKEMNSLKVHPVSLSETRGQDWMNVVLQTGVHMKAHAASRKFTPGIAVHAGSQSTFRMSHDFLLRATELTGNRSRVSLITRYGMICANIRFEVPVHAKNIWLSENGYTLVALLTPQLVCLIFLDKHRNSLREVFRKNYSLKKYRISAADLSPDGKHFALGFESGEVVILDTTQIEVDGSLRLSEYTVTALCFDSTGETLAAGTQAGEVYLLNKTAFRQETPPAPVIQLERAWEAVEKLAVASEGSYVAASCKYRTVAWSKESGGITEIDTRVKKIRDMKFSGSGQYLVIAGEPNRLESWSSGAWKLQDTGRVRQSANLPS